MSVTEIGGSAVRFHGNAGAVEHPHKRQAAERERLVQQLRGRLERYRRRQARQAGWARRSIRTGLTPLDEVLPQVGLPCGAITEILADDLGVGSMTLAMRIAGRCIQSTKGHDDPNGPFESCRSIVLLDGLGEFYPPAAVQHGIPLERLIVVRVHHTRDAFWAADQALRCPAVGAVIAPFRKLDECGSRCLQLAAESSGSVGLILMPAHQRTKSFAAVRLLVEGAGVNEWKRPRNSARSEVGAGDAHLSRITVLKVREGMPAKPFLVDWLHETGDGTLHSLPLDRSVAKTG